MPGSLAVVELLSDRWFTQLSDSLEKVAPPTGPPVTIGQIVTGTPQGDIAYRIICDETGARVERGTASGDVTLTTPYEVAREIADGTGQVDHALLGGRIEVRGDVTALLRAGDALAALSAALRRPATDA